MRSTRAASTPASTPPSPFARPVVPPRSRRLRLALAVPAAAAASWLIALAAASLVVPPPAREASAPGPGERVGALHVHTVASDGGGTLDDVAAAARDVGLDFVLVSDHNRRAAPGPSYRDGPLLIVGEEVNTREGHLVVAGGAPIGRRDSVEAAPGRPAVGPDEGLRIAAHPAGRAPWRAWHPGHVDGLEIWNADSERRGDGALDWLLALVLLPARPMAALHALLDRPDEALAAWDRLLGEGHAFGVCAVDAHHRLPLPGGDVPFPSYRQSFRMARQHVRVDAPPTGDPREDAAAVLGALRRGSSYCGFDWLADARGLRMEARAGGERAGMGGAVPWAPGARLVLELPPAGRSAEIRLLRDGREVATARERRWEPELPGPGVYRVEVYLRRGRRVPWILTNAIRLEAGLSTPRPDPRTPRRSPG